MARLFNETRKAPFSGAVSTPHHAPSGEPSVALVAQKTRCGRTDGAGLDHCPTCRTNTRRAGRRAGTLTCLCPTDACTPYAPGAPGEPGSGDGNAEQSAPADRSVATARRASDTDSGSAASYTTPHTTRRPRLAWTNHRRRSAHGTTVTRQSRILTCHLPAQVFGRRAPGATTPGPT